MSEQFCDVGRGITICYETFGEESAPPLLLVMGLATQMIAWHEDFCRELAAQGLYVVRFDNRDIGRSTHVRARTPRVGELLVRSKRAASYTLADMAQDAAGLLRELELAPAHVVGASMGGMIAQTLAARHPESVRSLVSIMSNTGRRTSGQPALRLYPALLRRAPEEREAYLAHIERVFAAIGSRGLQRDVEDVRRLAEASYDRDRDPRGPARQLAAIIASGDRTSELRGIKAPTLVIHGAGDRLVTPSGGRATARAIPGAKLLMVDGMGHDLPRAVWRQLIGAIAEHAHAADAARDGSAAAQNALSPQAPPAPMPGLRG